MSNEIDRLPDDPWVQLVRDAVSMPDAPAGWVQSALDLWRQRGPAVAAAPPPRRWVAVLCFDSWAAAPAAAGMRALPSDVRHMLFAAQDLDIDLRVAPRADRFAISGQVLGRDVADGSVELEWLAGSGDSSARRVAPLDRPGEFSIDGVPAGTYLIKIRLAGEEIALAPIEIGALRDARGT